MRYVMVLVCLLITLTASVAGAVVFPTTQLGVLNQPGTWITVLTTATPVGPSWTWDYALTPTNANNIRGLTITLGTAAIGGVTGIVSPTGWTSVLNAVDGTVSWTTPAGGGSTLDSSASETFHYAFSHPWGPSSMITASAQDTYGYSGPVVGPAVPEPMSIMLGIMGLGSIAGFRKLRRK